MANFKLELLIPNYLKNSYFTETITSFYHNAKSSEGVNFSFNEKFSIHQNAQKDLTFDMTERLLVQDQWIDNPFINNLHIGSQLLLTDKYNRVHLFTIKNIKLNFSNVNTTYSYSCQDSFNYQMVRQNDGYAISNDTSSVDFIGAKTLDWWGDKIRQECHIADTYLNHNQILYYNYNGDLIVIENSVQIENCKDLIKKECPELKTLTVPFSCSGSNALNAYISLGESAGYSLMVFEDFTRIQGQNQGFFTRYFWFEPNKKDNYSGLKYSPYSNISNFNLDLQGDSLTTVLNVASHEVGEEMISLIPNVPPIFLNYFNSSEWTNSKYYQGLFKDLLEGKYFTNQGDTATIIATREVKTLAYENNYYYITPIIGDAISKTFTFDLFNNRFRAEWGTSLTHFFVKEDGIRYAIYNNHSFACFLFILVDDITDFYLRIPENGEIPDFVLGKSFKTFIGFEKTHTSLELEKESSLHLHFYRLLSKEETDFAAAADRSPWLENKIIDFSYFLQRNLITNKEYEELNNLIWNNLRILNGQLLLYSQEYYHALHQKTKIVAELESQVESLSAEFYASIISPYESLGSISDISQFASKYKQLFQQFTTNSNHKMLEVADLQSDYFNKYFKAEQRFLKNIYYFKQYFSMACNNNQEKHNVVFTLQPTENSNFISFSPSAWKSIFNQEDSSIQHDINSTTPIFTKIEKEGSDYYEKISVVNEYNYKNFYITDLSNSNFKPFKGNYNKNYYYYLPKRIYNDYFQQDRKEDFVLLTTTEIQKYFLAKHREFAKQLYVKDKNAYTPCTSLWALDSVPKWIKSFVDKDIYHINFPLEEVYYYDYSISYSKTQNDDGEAVYKETVGSEMEYLPITCISLNLSKDKWQNKYWQMDKDVEAFSSSFQYYTIDSEKDLDSYRNLMQKMLGFKEQNVDFYEKLIASDYDNGAFKQFVDWETTYYNSKYWREYQSLYSTENNYTTYYGNLVLTYSTLLDLLDSDDNFRNKTYFKDVYYSIQSRLTKGDSYYMLLLTDKEFKSLTEKDEDYKYIDSLNRFSAIKLWPLEKNISYFDTSSLAFDANGLFEISSLLTQNTTTIPSYRVDNNIVLILKKEHYDRKDILFDSENDNSEQYYLNISVNEVFNKETNQNVSITESMYFDDADELYYLEIDSTTQFIQPEEPYSNLIQKNTLFYKAVDSGFVPVVTFNDIQNNIEEYAKYYYLSGSEYSYSYFGEECSTFNLQVYLNNQLTNGDYVITQYPDFVLIDTKNILNTNDFVIKVSHNGVDYFAQCSMNSTSTALNAKTNGEFWFKYHNSEDSFLQEQALIIEEQLTEYWLQAYNASKFCKFFLPETWTDKNGLNNNQFFFKIISSTDGVISLNNFLVPDVKIWADPVTQTTLLPAYNFIYDPYQKTTKQDSVNYERADKLMESNVAFINTLIHLFNKNCSNHFICEDAGKTTYYYTTSGGLEWKNVLSTLSSQSSQYDRFDGIYGMMFTLSLNFLEENLLLYKSLLKEKEKLWQSISKKYPNILFEQRYECSTATSSEELYKMAELFFKDKNQPERNYSITITDLCSLLGYNGEELTIGTAIQLDNLDYYVGSGLITSALEQLLFITDISYTLRVDTGVALTVNTIKYEDKLIEQIVKFIR